MPTDGASTWVIPRSKAICQDETPALAEGVTEARLVADGLGTGVDWLVPVVGIVDRVRNEAPLELLDRASPFIGHDSEVVL